jgi:lysophospholipase L1-like esterase
MRIRFFTTLLTGVVASLFALSSASSAQSSPVDARTQQLLTDWPQLARYHEANASLAPEANRVVFFGDSITDAWPLQVSFPGKRYVNRGISGQTTPQMLVRFRPDVVALKPRAVVILAGTNDVAGNTGPETLEQIEDNLASMCDLARSNGIAVVLSSVLPTARYPWKPEVQPAPKIAALNSWIKTYATAHRFVYLDYFDAMALPDGSMRAGLSVGDGVHPNAEGYRIMAPLAERAILEALRYGPGEQ